MSNYNRKDSYYQQAKAEGYRSRAAYKLLELDKKYRLLKPGYTVLDLGAAPGGWLQVCAQKIGPNGLVIGVDREPIKTITNSEAGGKPGSAAISLITGDILSEQTQEQICATAKGKLDLIISDMSPNLSGVQFRDAAQSAALVEIAFNTAAKLLKPGANFVAKIFPGEEADQIFLEQKANYKSLLRCVLKSTRKSSNEFYFVAKGLN